MKYDVNGWNFLEDRLKNFPETGNIFDAVLGRNIDLELIARGIHLLDIRQIKLLATAMHLNKKQRHEFFNQLITARCSSGCDHDLEELKSHFCELNRERTVDIPCAEIDILWHYQPLNETLHSFMKRVAVASYSGLHSSGSCAFRVTDCRMTAVLGITPGSMIIVNGTTPALPDELALYQCHNRRLGIGKTSERDPARIKWTAPVIQLRLKP